MAGRSDSGKGQVTDVVTEHASRKAAKSTRGSASGDQNSKESLRRSARLAKLGAGESPTSPSVTKPGKGRRRTSKTDSGHTEDDSNAEFTERLSKPVYKLSSMDFPNVEAPSFGLAQEKLADEPLKVLIACVFLTRTKGIVSMPVCRRLFEKYPTAESLANAPMADVVSMFQPLGLQNRRAKTVIDLASAWNQRPAEFRKRYRKLHYPKKRDGLDISKSEEPIRDEADDPRVAWEIGHLPGVGAYALDSWRIFCRDALRGVMDGLQDVSTKDGIAQEKMQEWTRVIPLDKELIAYIRWRWLRLGYLWNPIDGSKIKVDDNLISRMQNLEILSYIGFDNPWSVYGSSA